LLKLLQELDYRKGKRFWDGRIVQATNAMRLDLNEELGSYTYKQEMSIIVWRAMMQTKALSGRLMEDREPRW